jgi:cytochrome b subunit of formate dehydrogenase
VTGPSWKHRRKLIHASWALGAVMVVTGGLMFLIDQFGVGVTLITGGVSLISIILTAYTGFATFEDIKLWSKEENPDG